MTEKDTRHTNKPPSSWKVLFLGILRPGKYMQITESSQLGPAHFYRTFGFYCLLPVVLLNVAAIIAEGQSARAWRFQDINPWTVVIAVPAQLIIGPLIIWILAWCLYGGMNTAGLKLSDGKERVLTTGWYVGTTLHCLWYWWIGFGVFFSSIRSIHRAVEPVLTASLVIGFAIWLWVAISAYKTNIPERSIGTSVRTFFGLIVGVVLFALVMIPAGFLVQILLVAILRGM